MPPKTQKKHLALARAVAAANRAAAATKEADEEATNEFAEALEEQVAAQALARTHEHASVVQIPASVVEPAPALAPSEPT